MRLFRLIAFFLITQSVFAQQNTLLGGAAFDVNSSSVLNSSLSLKYGIGGRYISLLDKEFKEQPINIEDYRIDVQSAIERKFAANSKISAGAMFRLSERRNALRLFQQIGFSNRISFKLNGFHRFRFDETFRENSTEVRLRYRYGLEVPLAGLRIDKNEKYLVIEMEYLGEIENGEREFEWRFNPTIGHLFKNGDKAEIGIDFRYEAPFSNSEEKLFLLNLGYFFSR